MFGPDRVEVTGGGRGKHNDEIRGLYSSPDIFRATKSRRTRRQSCGPYGENERWGN